MNIKGIDAFNVNSTGVRFGILFASLVLVQVLIFNHILLFGVAVPLVFIFFIISLPVGMNINILYTLAFLLGLTVDVFSDTAGLNALSCVLLAALKNPVFYAYVQKDDKSRFIFPSISTIGWTNYAKYLITMTAIYCVLLFSFEYFSFASFGLLLLMIIGSTILTFFLLLALEAIFMGGIEKR